MRTIYHADKIRRQVECLELHPGVAYPAPGPGSRVIQAKPVHT